MGDIRTLMHCFAHGAGGNQRALYLVGQRHVRRRACTLMRTATFAKAPDKPVECEVDEMEAGTAQRSATCAWLTVSYDAGIAIYMQYRVGV